MSAGVGFYLEFKKCPPKMTSVQLETLQWKVRWSGWGDHTVLSGGIIKFYTPSIDGIAKFIRRISAIFKTPLLKLTVTPSVLVVAPGA